jgi:endonuclease/exonuclease/phosphatase family metal-dependent hydrolase
VRSLAVAAVLVAVAPVAAHALDVPVSGYRLTLRGRGTPGDVRGRSVKVVVKDPALAAPLPDPRLGAALLVNAGAGAGQCQAQLVLDPAYWRPLPSGGYRYAPKGLFGIRRIDLRPGLLRITAHGSAWPCDLSATTQRTPVSVVVRAADVRYCAAFGGTVTRNVPGRFAARDAAAPAACPDADITVADLNVLHGIFCPSGTQACRLAERVDLLYQWIAAAGCPDVVTLQEISTRAANEVIGHASTCPFTYQVGYTLLFGVDDAIVLSRYPIVTFETQLLYEDFRHVAHARIDHPIGALDVFTTHLASGSDNAGAPCDTDCPAECVAAGATTVRECQGVQVGDYVAATHDVVTPAVVTGDFNESPGSFVYHQLVDRGWPDAYLAAGNPECNPGTGIGCTAGRADEDLSEMESPASNEIERIDYAFLVPPGPAAFCAGIIEPSGDADGDGTGTRIFADDPNPFAATCGPLPDPICWPSDHEGVQVDLNCG